MQGELQYPLIQKIGYIITNEINTELTSFKFYLSRRGIA